MLIDFFFTLSNKDRDTTGPVGGHRVDVNKRLGRIETAGGSPLSAAEGVVLFGTAAATAAGGCLRSRGEDEMHGEMAAQTVP